MSTFLAILFVLICILLIGIVLIQKGRGGGLSGAFGGAGGHSAFGSRTGDMFTWITVVLVCLFLIIAVTTVRVFQPVMAEESAAAIPAELPAAQTGEPGNADMAGETDDGTATEAEQAVGQGQPAITPEAPATQPAQ